MLWDITYEHAWCNIHKSNKYGPQNSRETSISEVNFELLVEKRYPRYNIYIKPDTIK